MLDDRPIGASYARISGATDDRTASLETQEEECVSKLESEGYQVPPGMRFREQFTGVESIYDRPVLIRIRQLVSEGRIKALCSHDTDRLARDTELTGLVANTEKAGCKVLFVKHDHKTGRIGELVLYMKAFASSIEVDAIKDRTSRGRRKVRERGQLMGNGPCRYGFTFNPETRTRSAHPEHAETVREIFRRIAEGTSSVQLAEDLTRRGIPTPSASRGQRYKDGRGQRWNHSTVQGIVKDETYIGVSTAGRSEVVGKLKNGKPHMRALPRDQWATLGADQTEALISPELFRAANDALSARRNKPIVRRAKDSHLLAGRIYCAECGLRMTTTTKKTARCNGKRSGKSIMNLYRCTAKYPGRRVKVDCSVTSLSARRIDAQAWAEVARIVADPEMIEKELANLKGGAAEEQLRGDLDNAEARRKTGDRRLANLIEALSEVDSQLARSAVRDKIRQLEEEIADADRSIRELTSRLLPFERYEETCREIRSRCESIRAGILDSDSLTYDLKRAFMEWLGVRVLAHKSRPMVIEMDIAFRPAGWTEKGAIAESGSKTYSSDCAPTHITLGFAAIPALV